MPQVLTSKSPSFSKRGDQTPANPIIRSIGSLAALSTTALPRWISTLLRTVCIVHVACISLHHLVCRQSSSAARSRPARYTTPAAALHSRTCAAANIHRVAKHWQIFTFDVLEPRAATSTHRRCATSDGMDDAGSSGAHTNICVSGFTYILLAGASTSAIGVGACSHAPLVMWLRLRPRLRGGITAGLLPCPTSHRGCACDPVYKAAFWLDSCHAPLVVAAALATTSTTPPSTAAPAPPRTTALLGI